MNIDASNPRATSPFAFVRGGKLHNPYFSSHHSGPVSYFAAEVQSTPSLTDGLLEALSTWADANLLVPHEEGVSWSRVGDDLAPSRTYTQKRGLRALVRRAKRAMGCGTSLH
jgi:hypothetical protein